MDRIRVMVAEDEDTVLDVLSALLATDPTIDLVATAKDAERAIDLAEREHPDVALLDVRMPGGGGQRAAREISRRSPGTRIVAVSAHEDVDTVLAMLRAGATAYVVKDDPTGEILAAVHRCVVDDPDPPDPATVGEAARKAARLLDPGPRATARNRLRSERVREVLRPGRLGIVFQPIVDLRDGTVAGVEALARFDAEPQRSPDAWFADADAVGLLRELEMAALRRALAELPDLPAPIYLSVNLSPRTLCWDGFREEIRGVPAGRLVIELTEHAPVDDYASLNGALGTLRARGVRIAVDDAGSGFSSLRHIVRLTPELIKLDRTLVRSIDGDPTRRALVSALSAFTAELGSDLLAEGIETEAELRTVRELGVGFGQGFLLGSPAPLPPNVGNLGVALKRTGPGAEAPGEGAGASAGPRHERPEGRTT